MGAPKWVKVAGAITIVVIVGFIVLLLGGGDHGPGRHEPGNSMEEVSSATNELPAGQHR